jgi:hypothetical protein
MKIEPRSHLALITKKLHSEYDKKRETQVLELVNIEW